MPKFLQPSFAAGELTPAMYARTDLAKYRVGAKSLKNMFVHPQGGASNRAGFRYVATTPGKARLIPFRFNVAQTYVLEFSNYKMRIITEDSLTGLPGLVKDGSNNVVEVVSPFAEADLDTLRYAQSADTVFFAHPKYVPQKLVRTSNTDWSFSDMTFAISTVSPTGLTASYSRTPDGTTRVLKYQIAAIDENGEESLPSNDVSVTIDSEWPAGQTVAVSWTGVAGATSYRLYKSSRGIFGLIGELVRDYGKAPIVSALSSGDSTGHTADAAFDNILSTYWQSASHPNVGVGYIGAHLTDSVVVRKVRIRQPSNTINSIYLQYSADGTTWTTEGTYAISGSANVTTELDIKSGVAAPYWRVLSAVYRSYQWRVSELSFRVVGIATDFVDDNVEPDTSQQPMASKNPFTGTDNYPGVVSIFQQRLVYARTNNQPQTVWLSRTGLYENMSTSLAVQADDAIELTLDAKQLNEIRALVPLDSLLVLTAGSEWAVSEGANSDAIAPNSISAKPHGYLGTSTVNPLPIGRAVLFVQRGAQTIRELLFNLQVNGMSGTDISVLSNHLFHGHSIADWAYQQSPYSIVWAVRDDGVLLGLTYLKEQEVVAWHRHTTDGAFESVAVVESLDNTDALYAVVRRTVGGQTVRFIERLSTRLIGQAVVDGNFLDASLTYSGTAITEVTGLSHLEGRTVSALADGNVVRNLTVASGKITLPYAASKICVGLPYNAELETLGIEFDDQGTAQGKYKSIPSVVLRVQDSRAPKVGPDADALIEMKWRSNENVDAPTALFTGDRRVAVAPKWNFAGSVLIRMEDPLPLTVLAVIPEVEPGE